ncbi:MAG: hypothetical protein ACRC6T_15845 [Sarcina sp.]
MKISLNKFLNKKRKLTNKRWQAIIVAAFTRKVSYISGLTLVVILGMYVSSMISGKMFTMSNTMIVIIVSFGIQMIFSTRGIGFIKNKKFEDIESKNEEADSQAELTFNLDEFYAEERAGKSFVRYNLIGAKIRDCIYNTIILQLKDGSTCAMIDDVNTLTKDNTQEFIKKSYTVEKNERFEVGKKNISFDKALKVQENWSDSLRVVIEEQFADLLNFVRKFDKVIIAFVIFIFFKLSTVLAFEVRSKTEGLIIVGAGIVAGIFVAITTRKNRINFGVQGTGAQGRQLYVFETGIYNVTDAIEEYYSFKDIESVKVFGSDIVLNFEIGEIIVIKKDIFENNKEYFVAIEADINAAMGLKIEKVASVN